MINDDISNLDSDDDLHDFIVNDESDSDTDTALDSDTLDLFNFDEREPYTDLRMALPSGRQVPESILYFIIKL